jgi:hypothetical protein
MDYDERIDSDHLDYIGIDSYGGAADGIYNYLELNGFEVKGEQDYHGFRGL